MLKRTIMITTALVAASATAILLAEAGREASEVDHPASPEAPKETRMAKEREQELLNALKESRPAQYKRLIKLKESSPRRYRWALRSMNAWYRRWHALPKPIQEAEIDKHDLRIKTWRLVKQVRRASDEEEKSRLLGELRDVVAEMFDADQKILEYRLVELEKRIKQLNEVLKERKERRDGIIEEMVEDLLKRPLWKRPRRQPHAETAPPPGNH